MNPSNSADPAATPIDTVCVVGLGAVGGLLAARLARGGMRVSALVREPVRRVLATDGLALVESFAPAAVGALAAGAHAADAASAAATTAAATAAVDSTASSRQPDAAQRHVVRVRAASDAHELGPQRLVLLSLKTTALAEVAPRLKPLIGPDTIVLSAMNGVPWWFFHGLDGELARRDWPAIDPGGAIAAALPPQQVVGAVVHFSCSSPATAVVRHHQGNRLIVGDPSGVPGRADAVAQVLRRGGFEVELSSRIQQDVWFKLWGNMTLNPISALTGATSDRMMNDPLVLEFISRVMREAAEVGARIGLPIAETPEQRHQVTRKLGSFRTSMLQDLDAGRPLEIDALLGSVVEIARAVGVPTPDTDALLGLTRLHARVHGLYPD